VRTASRGFSPLDERWGLTRSVYAPQWARQLVWLSSLLPYAQVVEVVERIGHRRVASASIWRQVQRYGERITAQVQREQETVSIERTILPTSGVDHSQVKGISLDGGKVHLRGEGWKEFKVGAVFDVVPCPYQDPETREMVERARAQHIAYTAVIGPPEQLGPGLWATAVRQGVPRARDSVVVADGAEWIWHLVRDYFPDSVQILDWYHACEHLAQAGQALYPGDDPAAQRWYRGRQGDLFQGRIHAITLPLELQGLSEQAAYFHKHKRRMRYQEFREYGYPIGSGTVESGIKQCKARLVGAGMHWSRLGAERMLTLRTAVLSHRFDHLWHAAAQAPPPI